MVMSFINGDDEIKKPPPSKGVERVTIALDEETTGILKEVKEERDCSQSEIFRKALKFYNKYGYLFNEDEHMNRKIDTYLEMLSDGEHIIIDVDHYLSILKFIEDTPNNEEFWEEHRQIGRHHADQFKHDIKSFEEVVNRLETCNLFKCIKESSSRYTVLLGSDISKNFVKMMLEEIFKGMGIKADIREGFAKLRIFLNVM